MGLTVVLAGLVFIISVSSASAAGCEKNPAQSLFQTYANPLISFAEKTINGFGYNVALAAAPDPDSCGIDSVACKGGMISIWTTRGSSSGAPIGVPWSDVAMSADGKYQTAVVYDGKIYISSNYGADWSAKGVANHWWGVAMSADGQYQTAVALFDGGVYISADWGQTWSKVLSGSWSDVAISANGQYQTAVVSSGKIYISSDYGANWSAKGETKNWSGIAMSANGQYQTAVGQSGEFYTSSDWGATWSVKIPVNLQWNKVAMSSDGNYQTIVVYDGKIHTLNNYLVSSDLAAAISWLKAPSEFSYYGLNISGGGSSLTPTTTLPYKVISSGLSSNTTYNWSVEAYTSANQSSTSLGYTDQPYGSFTTPNCPPTADIKANGSDGPITIPYNTSATISWTSSNASSCTVSPPGLGWSGTFGAHSTGNLTSSKTYTLTCTGPGGSASDSVTVNVGAVTQYLLTVTKSGTGSGTVTDTVPGGTINCGSDCTENYTSGTSVTLTASADSNSVFTGWSGACSGTGSCTVTMDNNKTVTATFNPSTSSPDFSLNSSNSIYATILKDRAGDSTATTITVTPFNGFSSTVNLSVQSVSPSLPTGSTFSFVPTSLTSSQYSSGSQFKVHVGEGLSSSQTYTITIQGQDGGLVRTVDVYLNVQVKTPGWREI